ncbi:DUF3379 domain-containing protein [Vibrio intestinalis]|uniref:DUF3379 domain-containing protein n=1 Tax=Vibrio intestinalis TaxID=2933291 RepID=UPI0021A420E8|nr:DUF3379 domain-containing protein [Vibrio intestinalis]
MDELEFRRRIMSDPKCRDSDIVDTMRANENNNKFAEDILELDAQIAKAMNVDVPEDLADKILFNQSSRQQNNVVKPNFFKRSMALAASFAAGLMVSQVNWGNIVVPSAQASLATTAVQHVFDEQPFINNLDEEVSKLQINTKMAPFAHQLGQNFPYHVYYLNHCGFGESNALHMVFKGQHGKVTLFLTGIASSKVETFADQGLSGVIEPLDDFSLIIVGNDGEDVTNIAKNIVNILKPM